MESLPGVEWALARSLEAAGVRPGRPLVLDMGPPLDQMLERALPELEAAARAAVAAGFRTAYDREGWRRTTLHDGVAEALTVLRDAGARVFVVTNKRAQATAAILQELGIAPLIEAAYSPDNGEPWRTKSESIAAMLTDHSLDPHRTAYVGDHPDDERAAAACGVGFVGVTWGYGTLGADFTLAHAPGELPGVLGLVADQA